MDTISRQRRSENMRQIRSRDMKPEMVVRRLTHGLGYRYRLHVKDLPGKPDLVFPSRGKVIFVNGCFWHQHQASRCPISRRPKSNRDYWLPKLDANVARDKANKKKLRTMGWKVLVLWECWAENLDTLERRLVRFLDG